MNKDRLLMFVEDKTARVTTVLVKHCEMWRVDAIPIIEKRFARRFYYARFVAAMADEPLYDYEMRPA